MSLLTLSGVTEIQYLCQACDASAHKDSATNIMHKIKLFPKFLKKDMNLLILKIIFLQTFSRPVFVPQSVGLQISNLTYKENISLSLCTVSRYLPQHSAMTKYFVLILKFMTMYGLVFIGFISFIRFI